MSTNGKICCGVIQLNQFNQQANIHSSDEINCYHFLPLTIQDMPFIAKLIWLIYINSCSKVMGFVLRWQNMVFIFKVQTWHFVCGIRRSFALTMENILSVWYTATPGWTSKFGKVWKTRCQNAATRAIIWRCFHVSWDDKYLWVMVSNNRHELYFL